MCGWPRTPDQLSMSYAVDARKTRQHAHHSHQPAVALALSFTFAFSLSFLGVWMAAPESWFAEAIAECWLLAWPSWGLQDQRLLVKLPRQALLKLRTLQMLCAIDGQIRIALHCIQWGESIASWLKVGCSASLSNPLSLVILLRSLIHSTLPLDT